MCRSGRRSRGKRGCWRLAAMVPSSGYCGRQRPVLQELQRKISLWTPLKLGTPPIGDTSSPTSLPVLCIVPLPEFCDSELEEGRRGGASGVADGEFSGFTLLRLGRETTPAPTVPSPAGRLSAVGRLPRGLRRHPSQQTRRGTDSGDQSLAPYQYGRCPAPSAWDIKHVSGGGMQHAAASMGALEVRPGS